MRFRLAFLVALALSGCAGFDDHYYYHEGWIVEGYPAAAACGCPTTPHAAPQSTPHTPPPPFSGGPTITPVSGSSMSPQTREPELLR